MNNFCIGNENCRLKMTHEQHESTAHTFMIFVDVIFFFFSAIAISPTSNAPRQFYLYILYAYHFNANLWLSRQEILLCEKKNHIYVNKITWFSRIHTYQQRATGLEIKLWPCKRGNSSLGHNLIAAMSSHRCVHFQ